MSIPLILVTILGQPSHYLAIPATSAPIEQIFSSGTDLVISKRGALDPETICEYMCLKAWQSV